MDVQRVSLQRPAGIFQSKVSWKRSVSFAPTHLQPSQKKTKTKACPQAKTDAGLEVHHGSLIEVNFSSHNDKITAGPVFGFVSFIPWMLAALSQ